MLTNNKVGAYVAYAAGEIILVIVGILIALAINEHSNNEKKLELRNSYINQLNNEADRNLKKLSVLNNEANQMLKDLNTIFKLLLDKDYDNPKLATKSFFLIVSKKFFPVTITYENLKFSGDVKLFDDLNLRNTISETYETFIPIEKLEASEQQAIEAYYENFLMPKVQFRNMGITSESYGKDIYFENMVLTRMTTIAQNKEAYTNAIESLKKLKNTFAELQNIN
ncbi:DUF6090 family protein [Polaribacter dokdonensis]|uniref:Uncharacterized protein n=2 Tax=Polaribacter TaxID=52959 RepID=A0A0N0UP14_9FLAO|nr:DUF6090 family protein [Polaribacter dokdonensis]KOY53090.1 hypothetical protein I602_2650 [Polaribacter dokdonensis DSW-5]SEE57023.1 hypothetical protein SAMN05444353_2425 [Polaribacter dokdonensis DSW-5]